MAGDEIRARGLTTFDVDGTGEHVRVNLEDAEGLSAAVILPVRCLHQLLMTLPAMIQAAMRRSHADASVRLVHPLAGFTVERGEYALDGRLQFVLTLGTTGGFHVSFSAPEEVLASLTEVVRENVLEGVPVAEHVRLHS